MMLTSLLLTLSCLILTNLNNAFGQQDKCAGPPSTMKADCILSSCPSLKGVCPINSNKTINPDASNRTLTILNACIGQKGLICGINMNHTPLAQLDCFTNNLLPTTISGSINLIPGTGFLDNLSSTIFTFIPTGDPSGLIFINIQSLNSTMKSHFNCVFNISTNTYNHKAKRQMGISNLPTSLNTLNNNTPPEVYCTYSNEIDCLTSIDLSTPTPTINIIKDTSALKVSNFSSSTGAPLLQPVVTAFSAGMESFAKASGITATTILFLSTLVATFLQAAQLNCP